MNRSQQLLSSLGLAGAVSVLIAQPSWASVIAQVTAVRLNPTAEGLEIVLETEDGRPLQVFSSSFGETLYADVISTQLRLPGGNEFRQDNPAAGIASVTVTPLDTYSIRVKVIGDGGVPLAQVVPSDRGLILSLKPTSGTTARTPAPIPTQPTPPVLQQPEVQPTPPVLQQPEVQPTPPVLQQPEVQPTPPVLQQPEVQPTPPVLQQPEVQPAPPVLQQPEVQPTPPVLQPTEPTPPVLQQPEVQPTPPVLQQPEVQPAPPISRPPTLPTQPTAPPASTSQAGNPIEIVVTATRIEERVTNVPRSITVVETEEIQEQASPSRDVGETLANQVPGFAPPTQNTSTYGQTLRGRDVSVLIDGVPQKTNLQSFPREFRTIDQSAIERIEVVRGSSAIYGAQATGGVINIITRRPTEEGLTSTTEVGGSSVLTNTEDAPGFNGQHTISGREGNFDFTGSFSLASSGAFYDAEGDRIPYFENGGDSSRTLNVLGKVGVDLDSQQRLQLSVNHYNDTQSPNVIPDFSIDELEGRQKARAIETGELVIDGEEPQNTNTVINLTYTNENIFGSSLQGQIYYRDNSNVGVPSDFRTSDFFGPFIGIANSRAKTEQLGGRLQINTPLSRDENVRLVWGADYVTEDNEQRFDLYDPAEFDATGGRVYQKIGERPFVPAYDYNSLGFFGQLEWNIEERVILSGGVRHERIGLSVDDYTTFNERNIKGGERDFSATVFNAGAVYRATENFSIFGNFSQGFSVPDFGRILRQPPDEFTGLEDSLEVTDPQKVNNYEIGIRGEWPSVQMSLAAYYNTSDLGTSFQPVGNTGRLELIRAPERIYGIEATVDWQPEQTWALGGTATFLEGEYEDSESGDYLAIDSSRISPLKLTAYVENETLPGWSNRLQLLYVGNRDRAFEDGSDGGPISSYVSVDYVSAIKVGSGLLQIKVENLLNNYYFPVLSQYIAGFGSDSSNYAARGLTLSVNYRINW